MTKDEKFDICTMLDIISVNWCETLEIIVLSINSPKQQEQKYLKLINF